MLRTPLARKRLYLLAIFSFVGFVLVLLCIKYSSAIYTSKNKQPTQSTITKNLISPIKYEESYNAFSSKLEKFQHYKNETGVYFKFNNIEYSYIFSALNSKLKESLDFEQGTKTFVGFSISGNSQVLKIYDAGNEQKSPTETYLIIRNNLLVDLLIFNADTQPRVVGKNIVFFTYSEIENTKKCINAYSYSLEKQGSLEKYKIGCDYTLVGFYDDNYYFSAENSSGNFNVIYLNILKYKDFKKMDIVFKSQPRMFYIADQTSVLERYIVESGPVSSPINSLKIYTLDGVKIDLKEKLLSDKFTLDQYGFGFTKFSPTAENGYIPLNLTYSSEKGYVLGNDSKQILYTFNSSTNKELFYALNLGINYFFLNAYYVGGGGGSWEGLNITLDDLPNNKTKLMMVVLKHNPIFSQKINGPSSSLLVGNFILEGPRVVSSALKDLSFDQLHIAYSGLSIMDASADLSSFKIVEGGGDGCGGGSRYSAYTSKGVELKKEFGGGCLAGDESFYVSKEVVTDENLIYYSKMDKFLMPNDTQSEVVSETVNIDTNKSINFTDRNDFQCDTYKSFSQIRLFDLNTFSDILVADFKKYFNPSIEVAVICHYQPQGTSNYNDSDKFYGIFNKTTSEYRGMVKVDILTKKVLFMK